MQGASRQPVNAEEMLAELKRVVDSSTPPPSFRHTTASMVSKSGSSVRRAQIDKESERRIQATADISAGSGQPTVFRKATTPIARSWKLAAGGLALAGAAMIGATFALMNRAPDLPKRELAGVATEGRVRPQSGGQTVEPSSSAGPLMQDSRPTEPSQVGASETRPDAMTTPARGSLLPAWGEAVADAPRQPASLGLESVAPAFTPAPANPAPAPVGPQTAAQDGRRLQRRRPPPLRPVRRFRLRRRSRTPMQQPQRPCRSRLLSHRRRRSIQRENLPGNRPCKGQPRVRKPQQRQLFRLSGVRLSRRRRTKRRARPRPRKASAIRPPSQPLRRPRCSSGSPTE